MKKIQIPKACKIDCIVKAYFGLLKGLNSKYAFPTTLPINDKASRVPRKLYFKKSSELIECLIAAKAPMIPTTPEAERQVRTKTTQYPILVRNILILYFHYLLVG